jgi:hypothetical protein
MDANTANTNTPRTPRTTSRSAHAAQTANPLVVSRPATKKQIAECREQLTWLRDHGFTFSMLEHDTGKTGGWCYKVINDTDRYSVTTIDVAVIRASYRSAFRLHGREQKKYALMQTIIVQAANIMRAVEQLANEA